MSPERLTRIAIAVLTFCALLVLAPSKLLPIWEHAQPIVRGVLFVPVIILALQVLAFATHRGWLMVVGAVVAGLVGLGSLAIGAVSVIIAAFTGNLDVITSFFVVAVYGMVVAGHLGLTFFRRQVVEVIEPVPPGG
ncbi:MAG: hypothetical protein ABTQ32_13775 [Myxococcaceae bacterium]